jgi:membrane-bound lytic murein transglycosylase B
MKPRDVGAGRVARRAALACAGLAVAFTAAATIAPSVPAGSPEAAGPALTGPLRVPLATAIAEQSRRSYAPPARLSDAHPPSDVPFAPSPGAVPPTHVGVGVSTLAETGIPLVALAAYREAAHAADLADPGCHLSWTLLAGIGRVESDHGQFGGATLLSDGTSSMKIIGVALNGHGTEVVTDTDGGRLDGDPVFDHAVGPMQFIPSTWAAYGVDADGDGIADPFNINDAALAAAHYLCASGLDLSTRAGQVTAVLTYNHSVAYVAEVLGLAAAYAAGVPGVLSSVLALSAPVNTAPRSHTGAPKHASAGPTPTSPGGGPEPSTARSSTHAPSTAATSTHPSAPRTTPTTASGSATGSPSMTNSSSTAQGTATSSAETSCQTSTPSPVSSAPTPVPDSTAVTGSTSDSASSSAMASTTATTGDPSSGAVSCPPAASRRPAASNDAAAPGVVVLALLVLIGAGVRRRIARPAHI